MLASSQDEHARFGGVVPEIASRAHLEAMTATVRAAFGNAGLGYSDVDAVAVTCGLGLAGDCSAGVAAAKAYAAAWDVPLFGVNHLAGHVAADTLEHGVLPTPTLALLVSGGHTQLLRVDDLAGRHHRRSSTVDDAAGEAYDKVARLLGSAIRWPGDRQACPRMESAGLPGFRVLTGPRDALNTFFVLRVEDQVARISGAAGRWSMCPMSVRPSRRAVVDVTAKTVRAATDLGIGTVVVAGGVALNGRLRQVAEDCCAAAGSALRAETGLCTDNGAMIAVAGGAHGGAAAAPWSNRCCSPATLGRRTRSCMWWATRSEPDREPGGVAIGSPTPPAVSSRCSVLG